MPNFPKDTPSDQSLLWNLLFHWGVWGQAFRWFVRLPGRSYGKARLHPRLTTGPEVRPARLLRLFQLGLGLMSLITAGVAIYALYQQEATQTNARRAATRQAVPVMAQKTAPAGDAEAVSVQVTVQAAAVAAGRQEAAAVVQATAEATQTEVEELNQIIHSLRLAAAATQALNQSNYEVALLLAVEAGRAADTPEAFAALRQALTRPGRTRMILKGARQASWNADGSRILAAGCDQRDDQSNCIKDSVRVWDTQTGQELLNLAGPRSVTQASWNADESRLLAANQVWDAATGQELFKVSGSQAIWNVDGNRLLTFGGDDSIVQVWDAATGQKLFDLTGHTDRVTQASWNATGSRILTVDYGGIARVWDAQTGQELFKLTSHTDRTYLYQASWNADSSRILTAEYDLVSVWDATTGQERLSLTDHPSQVLWAGWNSDGSHILTTYALPIGGGAGEAAQIWDAVTGQELLSLTDPQSRYFVRASWNADGSRLLTVNEIGTTRVWDTATGQELLRLIGGGTWLTTYAGWNPDERRILTITCDHFQPKYDCTKSSVHIWDAATSQELFRLTGHSDEIEQATWNADGSLILTTSADGTARVWDTEPGEELFRLDPAGRVEQATWNADGSRLLTLTSNATQAWDAAVWDAATGQELFSLIGHGIYQASWNAAGDRLLTANGNGTVRVWDATTGQELFKLSGHAGRVNQATWNAGESHILTVGEDGTVRVWDAVTGQERFKLSGSRAMWSVDGSRLLTFDGALTTGEDGIVRVWDAATGQERFKLSGSRTMWNVDGSRLLTFGDSGAVRVWDAQTGQELLNLIGSPHPWLGQAIWNSDGSHILAMGEDSTMRVWDVVTGQERFTLPNPSNFIDRSWQQATWNADSSFILTFTPYSLFRNSDARVWDAATGQALFDLEDRLLQATWNVAGSRILTAGRDGAVRVWDAQTGQELLNLITHTAGVDQANWNADESRILTMGCDRLGSTNQHYERYCIENSVRVWDAATGQELFSLTGYPGAVTQATWNASESRLLTMSNGVVWMHYTQMKDLLMTACQRAPRNLTRAEWTLFIKVEPYRATCENLPVED